MTHLRVVDLAPSWSIFGPGMASDMELFDSAEEALADLILHPEKWPESVDFWLFLARYRGMDWPSLARREEDLIRPVFETTARVRYLRNYKFDRTYIGADFWFVVRFVEALVDLGVMFDIIPGDGTDASRVDLLTASPSKLADHLLIRRKKSWARDFLFVTDDIVLRWFGVEPIERLEKRRGRIIATRLSHRSLS